MEKKVYVYPDKVNEVFYKSILPLLKKYKIKEKDIDTIANSIEESYHIGWSSGYHGCEMDIDESI